MSNTSGGPGLLRRFSLPSTVRLGVYGALGLVILLFAGCSIAKHSVTVQPGEVGVLVRTLGANAGVDPTPLAPGWHFVGLGERVVQYPSIERSYAYTRDPNTANGGGEGNEEVSFSDHTGLPITADVQVVLRVNPAQAPKLYSSWRLSFDQLFATPIRNDIRSAIAAESELISADDMMSGGRQAMIGRALARVQAKWSRQGVEISQLSWLGNLRYPQSVLDGITRKSQVDQATMAAQGKVAQAKAEADAKIEEARGLAESTRLQALALRASPEVLRQKEIERWNGMCPLNVKTCIVGSSALAQVQAEEK